MKRIAGVWPGLRSRRVSRGQAGAGRPAGVALVFALFTTAVLISMSATFVGLSIRHGRSGTVFNHGQSALHAANWGLEYTLCYMGKGGDDASAHWEVNPNLVSRYQGAPPSYRLRSTADRVFLLDDRNNPVWRTTVRALGAGKVGLTFSNTMEISADSHARIEVTVEEIPAGVPGQPSHYLVQSEARVLDRSGTSLASRVVQARVREQTAADFLHLVQNARVWDAPGTDVGDDRMDLVGIPKDYTEAGRMWVDGGGSVESKAGQLRFYDYGASNYNVKFEHNTTFMKNSMFVDSAGSSVNPGHEGLARIFSGGTTDNAKQKGLPQKDTYISQDRSPRNGVYDSTEVGYASSLAQDVEGGSYVNGRIQVGGSHTTAVKTSAGGPYGDVEYDPNSPDRRPGLATVEVILNGDRVTIQKVGRFSKNVQVVARDVPASSFKNGVISVEGGNVKVKSVMSGGEPVPFTGSLSIVSNENPSRVPLNDAGAPTFAPGSIYHQAAKEYLDANPYVHKPPFTAKELGLAGDGVYWPPPAANVEREGNTVIASDIKYGETGGKSPSLGLISKNFVLLNDETVNTKRDKDKLEVSAVVMSLDHSLQFDWDNTGNNPHHGELMSTKPSGRTFKFNGAIIGGFLDVEGDVKGRGYTVQDFGHDENLRYKLPPAFPTWDRRRVVDQAWVILQYVDRGTLSGDR